MKMNRKVTSANVGNAIGSEKRLRYSKSDESREFAFRGACLVSTCAG